MKKRITIIGRYASDGDIYIGQTLKTRTFYDELNGTDLYDINVVDTYNWKNNIFKIMNKSRQACKVSDYIILMSNETGFSALSILLPMFSKKSKAKIIYVVSGGWLPEFLSNHQSYINRINSFSSIVVETNSVKNKLEHLGVNNLSVIPNFKRLDIVKTIAPVAKYPYRFCTFSRVMKEKGIEDAIECIKRINEKYDNDIVTLDIYGQIDEDYEDEFKKIINHVPKYIRYKGIADYNESVEALRNYYAMLFPTTFSGECLAGTVIDAFSAGLPVIAYDWDSGKELITDGVEGWLCEPSVDNLTNLVEYAIGDQDMIVKMKINCAKKAQMFTPDMNLEKFVKILMDLS